MDIEEVRKAIDKYQKEHPLYFGKVLDVTAISSKEGADIISQTIERVSKKIDEDTELWCICEMAKMYINGVRPVYNQDAFKEKVIELFNKYDVLILHIGDKLEPVRNTSKQDCYNLLYDIGELIEWRRLLFKKYHRGDNNGIQ